MLPWSSLRNSCRPLQAAPMSQVSVPTSVGYGASLSGIAPLLSSLNTCSPGMTVVNIDNGFGAAMTAARMLKMADRLHHKRAESFSTYSNISSVPAYNGDGFGVSTNGTSGGHSNGNGNGHVAHTNGNSNATGGVNGHLAANGGMHAASYVKPLGDDDSSSGDGMYSHGEEHSALGGLLGAPPGAANAAAVDTPVEIDTGGARCGFPRPKKVAATSV